MFGAAGGVASAEQRRDVGSAGLVAFLGDYLALLKPRVMSLVVFSGGVGFAAVPGPAELQSLAVTLLMMALGAGGCGALNMWYDADIDAVMRRTQTRPIPRGRVPAHHALVIGVVLSAASVALLGWAVNWLASALLAFTIAFYILVYTVGLKRRTSQNIVIGGAAGALPPVIGWAAASGEVGLGALALFLIIFLWTPPHFWALAIARAADYAKAGVPMMPCVAGAESTARQILIYSAGLAASTFLPLTVGVGGTVFLCIAIALNGGLLWRAVGLFNAARQSQDVSRRAMGLFGFSILYLFALFLALLVTAS